jgi:hypothetical protein
MVHSSSGCVGHCLSLERAGGWFWKGRYHAHAVRTKLLHWAYSSLSCLLPISNASYLSSYLIQNSKMVDDKTKKAAIKEGECSLLVLHI